MTTPTPTPSEEKTCGTCEHSRPCRETFKEAKFAPMEGWLVCLKRQNTIEDKARFISPYRKACSLHAPKV